MSIEFDTGPLTWVKGEIDQALQQARGKLAQFSENASDSTPLRLAQTHLHQVTGAIQMVGLDGAAKFGEAIEKMVSALENREVAISGANLEIVNSALSTLSLYLENLLNGKPDQPLRLYPQYEALQRARGIERVNESELFFPDITIRAPKSSEVRAIAAQELPIYLKSARAKYQHGLLGYLKNQSDSAPLHLMHDALENIEQTQSAPVQRTFWWTAVGLIDSLAHKGLESTPQIKQLCGGIDQQIRRLVEGSPKVAERLLRDVLYFVARSAPVAERIRAIQDQFSLHSYLPESDTSEKQCEEDEARRQPILRELRDLTQPAKEAWLKYTAGNLDGLKTLQSQLKRLIDRATALENAPLNQLLGQISYAASALAANPASMNETVAMEMATALLLAENSLERYQGVTDEFSNQSDVVCKRLQACLLGTLNELDVPEIELLDEISRKAQEKLLLAQVGQEILSNLQHIEQTLDTFFRDNAQRDSLPGLRPYLKQIYGALKILDLEPAVALLDECEQLVNEFCHPEYQADQTQMELAAEGLSSLGFYVEAIQRGTADADNIITSALSHLNPSYAPPSSDTQDSGQETHAESGESDASSIESGLDAQKEKTQTLLHTWQQNPADEDAKQAFAKQISSLQQDADLVADESLRIQAGQAKKLVEAEAGAPSIELGNLVSQICAPKVAMAAPSEASTKLAQEEDETIDAEMLEIFLEEAGEVLGAIGEHLEIVQAAPDDKDALTSLRRSFHTLKGSGRMVGLWDLGEVAWGIEQLMNKWLQDEKNATPELLNIISRAHKDFVGWVEGLKTHGSVHVDAKTLLSDAESLRSGTLLPQLTPEVSETPAPQPVLPEQAGEPVPESPAPLVKLQTPEAPPQVLEMPVVEELEAVTSPVLIENIPESVLVLPTDGSEIAASFPEIALSAGEMLSDELLPEVIPTEPESILTLEQPILAELPDEILSADGDAHVTEFAEGEIPPRQVNQPAEEPSEEVEVVAPECTTPDNGQHEMQTLPEEAPATEIQIGDLLISSELFKIFLGEANQHLGTLNQHMSKMELNPSDPIQHDFMRAAHTLCGIARTVGFTNVAELAFSLEACLLDLLENPRQLNTDQRKVMADSIGSLVEMVGSISENILPGSADALIVALQAILREAQDTRATPTVEPVAAAHLDQAKGSPVPAPEAQVSSHPEHERERRAIRDDIDQELLPIFLEEAQDLFPLVGSQLRAWRTNTDDTQTCANLQRALHTIKGSARMAGAMRLGELTHNMETQVITAAESGNISAILFDTLDAEFDRMADVLEQLQSGTEQTAPQLIAVDLPEATSLPGTVSAAATVVVEPETAGRAMLRIRADVVDRLVSEAGEVSIARSRIEGEMQGFKRSLLELTESINRLRGQLREIEIQAESQMQSRQSLMAETHDSFDPLEFDRFTRLQEVTRMMAESVNDVASVQHNLLKNLDETDAALLAQSRMTKELQQELLRARMIPLSSISDRLYRIVRQTSKELGKRATLEILGDQVELDRSVLEKMTAPFEHLLRNAIDHGLEGKDVRLASGKEEAGTITLQARQEGNEIQLSLSDDGGGIDLNRVRSKAIDLGLLQPDTEVSSSQLTELIFAPGFSTATEVTQVSGRGIGMDVVRNEITGLGGRVEVTTVSGKGTQFSIYLPLTLAVTQTIMVQSGNHVYALPSTMVDQVQELKADALAATYEAQQVIWQGNNYPLYYLPRLLGDEETMPSVQRYTMLILLHSGPQRVAIHVDELMGNREVVVKNIGPQLARVPGISGATVLGNGQVILILNPVQLGQRYGVTTIQSQRQTSPAIAAQPVSTPVIMIVDDSLTVRKITSKLLIREGYEVITAKDGVDALQILEETTPQVMLVDIEMPRMDGFEFTKNIRSSTKTANIPIIMITSRTAEKHRNYAQELGVNVYLGKPYQEEELLGYISGFVKGNLH